MPRALPILLPSLLTIVGCALAEPAQVRSRRIEAPAPGPVFMPSDETPGPVRLTVPEAVALAVDRNPDLGVAAARVLAASREVAAARSAWYPTLGLSVGYTYANDPASTFIARLRQRDLDLEGDVSDPEHRGNVRAAAEASWLLYDGGLRSASVDLTRIVVSMEEAARDSVLNELKAAVIGTSLAVFEASEFVKVSEDSVNLVTEQLQVVKSRHEAGAAQRSDVLTVEVRLAEAKERHVRAGNAHERALAALRNLLGLDADDAFVLDAGEGFSVPSIRAGDLHSVARENRPELARAREAVRAAEKEREMRRSEYLPKLSAFGTYALDDENGTFNGNQDSYVVGLRAELPVFEGFRTRSRLSASRARIREAQAAERRVLLLIEQDVTRSRLDLEEARARRRSPSTWMRRWPSPVLASGTWRPATTWSGPRRPSGGRWASAGRLRRWRREVVDESADRTAGDRGRHPRTPLHAGDLQPGSSGARHRREGPGERRRRPRRGRGRADAPRLLRIGGHGPIPPLDPRFAPHHGDDPDDPRRPGRPGRGRCSPGPPG
jgi:outer membrane protein TolC